MKKYIALAGLLLLALSALAQEKNATRRKYRPSQEFLQNSNPVCFEATKAEANRAFSLGYWDDAGKLYRAAKNCIDANQTDRAWLNERIEACRKAAEDELLAAQAEAFRRERHAVAANRADDAQELLAHYDRSLAFRLADFANEYIAPPGEDNPDCVQAMLETWNYNPRVHSYYTAEEQLEVPFCYELARNLGDSVQVRFAGTGAERRLYAFSPHKHQLSSWKISNFQQEASYRVDTLLTSFEVSPDGQTLVLLGKNLLIIWRGPRQTHGFVAPGIANCCFDEKGEQLFFDNPQEGRVYSLNLRDLYSQVQQKQQNVKSRNFKKNVAVPQVFVDNLLPGWLALSSVSGELWVTYPDSLLLCKPVVTNRDTTVQRRSIFFNLPPVEHLNYGPERWYAWQDPDRSKILLSFRDRNFAVRLSPQVGIAETVELPAGQMPLTIGSLVKRNDYEIGSKLEVETQVVPFKSPRFLVPLSNDDQFTLFSGDLSADLPNEQGTGSVQWLAAVNTMGVLKLWELKPSTGTTKQSQIIQDGQGTFSQDGKVVVTQEPGKIHVISVDGQVDLTRFRGAELPFNVEYLGYTVTQDIGGGWAAASRWGSDSLVLFQYRDGNRTIYISTGSNEDHVLAFSQTGDRFAHVVDYDSVAVYALDNQGIRFLSGRRFGLFVTALEFIPASNKMVVQRGARGDEPTLSMIIPKIWDYSQPATTPLASVYLEKYFSSMIVANPDGQEVAFSDGVDVRIYHLDNLVEEAASVRGRLPQMVTALAYSPDGKTLAVGYSSGWVAFFNPLNGRRQFVLESPAGASESVGIVSLAFADNGRQLRTLNASGELASYSLDRDLIREQVQGGGRRLVAFSSEQIGQWELDRALDYDENFEQLANSGDVPLIRAFFDFFSNQSRLSNNIKQVRDFCQRATELYDQLDPESRKVQEETLILMYDDYFWKLAQRNLPAEVETQVAKLQQRLKRLPLGAIRASAHAALLRNDLRKAARLYTEWVIQADEEKDFSYFPYPETRLQGELTQLYEYGLLDQAQRNLVCTLFEGQLGFESGFCLETPAATGQPLASTNTLPLDNEAKMRWQVFLTLRDANNTYGKMSTQVVSDLERTLQQSRQLARQNPQTGRPLFEKNLIALAGAQKKVAELEQGNAISVAQYRQAIAHLQDNGHFGPTLERERLDLLGTLYLQLGNCLLNNDPARAIAEYQKGVDWATQLSALVSAGGESPAAYDNRIAGPLEVQMGKAYLLLNKPAEARAAFEEAGPLLINGLNGLYLAHAAVLSNDEYEAFINYGDISTEDQLALAMSELHQLADRNKGERAAYLRTFAGRIKEGVLGNHPEFDRDLVEYRFAEERLRLAGTLLQWDSAYFFANVARTVADNWLKNHSSKDEGRDYFTWATRFGDAMLNTAYYALYQQGPGRNAALTQAIEGSEKASQLTQTTYYESRGLFLTNEAHAYLLLGQTDKALELYRQYVDENQYGQFNPVEILLKDWRDLIRAGVKFPDGLKVVAKEILPPGVSI